MITKKYILFLFCFNIIALVGCQRSHSGWPTTIPDTEIIFQGTMDNKPYRLGFIQSDGLNPQIVEVKDIFRRPVWSSDGQFLVGLTHTYGQAVPEEMGYPMVWGISTETIRSCTNNLPIFGQIELLDYSSEKIEVLLANLSEIQVFEMRSCQTVEKWVDFYDENDNYVKYTINGFSYQPKSQELLYGTYDIELDEISYHLFNRNITNGEEKEIAEGINPSWSPDFTQIAYLGEDGIYVIQADGSHPRKILEHTFKEVGIGKPAYLVPVPRWSPDGLWLVFHLCLDFSCDVNQTPIYKLRVSDGHIEQIYIGGKFPTWLP